MIVARSLAALALLAAAPALAAADPLADAAAARRAGRNAEAVALLAPLVAAQPDNSDAQIVYGFALMALGRTDEARVALERAHRLAPDDADAAYGLALLAERRGDAAGAAAYLKTVPRDYADADALRQRLTGRVSRPFQLDLDAGPVWVRDGQDWQEAALGLTWRAPRGQVVVARVEHSRRFGQRDTYGEARIEQPYAPGSIIYLLAGAAPNADFRPEWQLGAGLRQQVRAGGSATVLTLDARRADYASGAIASLTPGIEQYLDAGRAWIIVQAINLHADHRWQHGVLARVDRELDAQWRAHVGAASAPEMSEGRANRTRSLFAGVRYQADERWIWRATLSNDKPRGRPARTGLLLGVGVRFR